jgi:Protein of unknown function (DUF1320)
MSHQYLTREQFLSRTIMPKSYIYDIESEQRDFTDLRLVAGSAKIDGMLRKRYLTPFYATPLTNPPVVDAPEVVRDWLCDIANMDMWVRHAPAPTDEGFQFFLSRYNAAIAQILNAANAETGLWDLPLNSTDAATGITGGVISGSWSSPYAEQRDLDQRARGGSLRRGRHL